MLVLENILLALSGLRSNLMRSLLTMLGIIIGIASVIAIMTVGNSMSTSINNELQSMGANDLTVSVTSKSSDEEDWGFGGPGGGGGGGFSWSGNISRKQSTDDNVTDEMLEEFEEEFADRIDGIKMEEKVGEGTLESGDNEGYCSITGVSQTSAEADKLGPEYDRDEDEEWLCGRGFTDQDFEEGRKVCIVEDAMLMDAYGSDFDDYESLLGQPIDFNVNGNYVTFTVIGIMHYDTSWLGDNYDTSVVTDCYIPYLAAREVNHTTGDGYSSFSVVGKTEVDLDVLTDEIEAFFEPYYYANNFYTINVSDNRDILSSITSMMTTISVALSVIAGISLLVGGIGVMNIMLVSITERTKEIGTRKALGATNGSIRLQFIMESIVICIIGGIIGIILGIIMAVIAVHFMDYTPAISLLSIIIAVGFSSAIGLFFGYYPANKAAKLNPIDALRYE